MTTASAPATVAPASARRRMQPAGVQATIVGKPPHSRVRACDQEIDAGMVDAAQPETRARLPRHAVIERAGSETCDHRRCKDCGGGACASRVRADDQDRRDHDRDEERHLMENAAQLRLLGSTSPGNSMLCVLMGRAELFFLFLSFHLFHLLSL